MYWLIVAVIWVAAVSLGSWLASLYRTIEFLKLKIHNQEELLSLYRPLSDKLVSGHHSATFLHFKVRSDYATDGNRDRAIETITSLLKDKLP